MTADPIRLTSASEDETRAIGVALGRVARAGDVFALEGELGAGKTRLVRAIAEGLGIDPGDVSSPTYTIANEYAGGRCPLVHVDAYRFDGAGEDLDAIGWDAMTDGSCVLCVEWPARLGAALPEDRVRIEIHHAGAQTRVIAIGPPDGWHGSGALVQLLRDRGALP